MRSEAGAASGPDTLFRNQPLAALAFQTRPLAGAMGAEVDGVDLRAADAALAADIATALHHHKMLCFNGQRLDYAEQAALTAHFGEFAVDAFTPGVEHHPGVQRVVKEADERVPMVFGGSWHTDSAFLERPPSVSLLYAVDVPDYGGDTWWTNTALAYRALSDTMRAMLAGLRVHMSAEKVLAGLQRKRDQAGLNAVADDVVERDVNRRGSFHPLVRTHDVTGERSLYVDQTYSVGIRGLRRREADALIRFLVEHVTQPAFTCRLRWRPGMLVMWDNRSTLHHAFNDYDGARREMVRTIVQGGVPA